VSIGREVGPSLVSVTVYLLESETRVSKTSSCDRRNDVSIVSSEAEREKEKKRKRE
jgi:hypothetical protein